MDLALFGVNHRNLSLEARERFLLHCRALRGDGESSVFLNTCNRVEVYLGGKNANASALRFLSLLEKQFSKEEIYLKRGEDCFFHLARVTLGLDSALIFETEIQGQVKEAYLRSQATLSPELHFLFQKSLQITKRLRSLFSLDRFAPNMALGIASMAKNFYQREVNSLLFLGASRLNVGLCRRLKDLFPKASMSLCNRDDSRALQVAASHSLELLPWENIHRWPSYELVVAALHTPFPILFPQLRKESSVPRLLIDLSVPRSIHPSLREEGHRVVNIDELDLEIAKKEGRDFALITQVKTELEAFVVRQLDLEKKGILISEERCLLA